MSLITESRHGTGWVPDVPSFKDHKLTVAKKVALPASVDLRTTPFYPPIVDQQATNSCTGNSAASCLRFLRRKLGLPDFQPSRLFAYFFGRFVHHTDWHTVDEGAMIRDVMTALTVVGVCDEAEWPFDPAKVNVRPDPDDIVSAAGHKTLRYVRMLRGTDPAQSDLYYLKHSLMDGYPWVFGMSLYTSFFDVGDDGLVPMPKWSEKWEGGHAMYCVGYDEYQKRFIVTNSWGTGWGDNGCCYIPFDYFRDSDLSDDFWTLRTVIG